MDYQSTPQNNQVWYYDQITEKLAGRITKRGPGFCAGLCVVWIKLRAAGSDFAANGQGSIDVGKVLYEKVYAIQAKMEETTGKKLYRSQLEPDGLDISKALRTYPEVEKKYSDGQLAQIVVDIDNACSTGSRGKSWFLLRMTGEPNASTGKVTGHVVAIEVESQWIGFWTYVLFDPNHGCVRFNGSRDFTNWLTTNFFKGYRDTYTGGLKLHKVSSSAYPLATDVLQVESMVNGMS